MNQQEIKQEIKRTLGKENIDSNDLLSLFADKYLFSEIIKYFSDIFNGKIDYIVSPEASGWILAGTLASELNIAFVGLRKEGRQPCREEEKTMVRYRTNQNALEVKKGDIPAGSIVLIVDDRIGTGDTMQCCIELLGKERCTVYDLAAIFISDNDKTKAWIDNGFISFIDYANN